MAANRPTYIDPFRQIDNTRRAYQEAIKRTLNSHPKSFEYADAQKAVMLHATVAKNLGIHPLLVERWEQIVKDNHNDK